MASSNQPPEHVGRPPMPELEGVSHRYVDIGEVTLHIAEAGSGDPVLLVHGWPQNWYAWRGVLPLLAGQRRVICPDLRGFGWSDAPPGRYEKETFARDMLLLLDRLELDRVDLIAHDWGAWTGFRMCLEHPERIDHYLALNMITPWPPPPSPKALLGLWRLWYQVALAVPGGASMLLGRTDFISRLVSTGSVHRDAWSRQDLKVFQDTLREPARIQATKRLYRTFLTRELAPYVAGRFGKKRLSVPTLLLHGTRDPAIDHRRLGDWQANADEMAVELRHDSAHFIAEELPEFVAARAKALFDGARPADIVSQ